MVYAVKEGRKRGIYNTWKECQHQVLGYRGAVYKKFPTTEEAQQYLEEDSTNLEEMDYKDLDHDEVIAYVDGSYDPDHHDYGYGVILIDHLGVETPIEGRGSDERLIPLRNVAGELLGAVMALKMAIQLGKRRVYLHYDYQGIECWATGEWKTKNFVTQQYRDFVDSLKFYLDVIFVKVKAHSGVYYNNKVDKLAKMR